MADADKIIIPLSKTKLFLMFLASVAFVACGIWLGFYTPESISGFNRYFAIGAGIAGILFFGLCAALLFLRLFNNKPGLLIDDIGITDNSGGVKHGLIVWEDISGIEVLTRSKQDFIAVYVKDPHKYIDNGTSFFARKMKLANHKFCGTPITISSNGLKIKFKTLYSLLIAEYYAYLKKNDPDQIFPKTK